MRKSSSSSATSTWSSTQGADVDFGKARVAAVGGVEGRESNQTVDATLGGEQPVRVLPPRDQRRRLETRLLAWRRLLELGLEATLLGPAQVHAKKHLLPIL